MMIPLATAWFDSLPPVQELKSAGCALTAEQKRRNVKCVKLREGPRSRQAAILAIMWTSAALIAFERIIISRPDTEPSFREYTIQTSDASSKEIK